MHLPDPPVVPDIKISTEIREGGKRPRPTRPNPNVNAGGGSLPLWFAILIIALSAAPLAFLIVSGGRW